MAKGPVYLCSRCGQPSGRMVVVRGWYYCSECRKEIANEKPGTKPTDHDRDDHDC